LIVNYEFWEVKGISPDKGLNPISVLTGCKFVLLNIFYSSQIQVTPSFTLNPV